MKLPENYRNSDLGSFDFTVYKVYREASIKATTTKTVHMIVLAGGPGFPGNDYDIHVMEFLKKPTNVIYYLPDHRGTGESGSIPSDSFMSARESADYDTTALAIQFPNITLEFASADIVAFAKAIKGSGINGEKIVLFGFSYGALWAYTSASVEPIFDDVIAGGFQDSPLSRPYDSISIFYYCMLDSSCRKYLGTDPLLFGDMIRALANPKFNQCTALFHKKLHPEKAKLQGPEMIRYLGSVFEEWILETVHLEDSTVEMKQLMILFLKATYDCIDVSEYKSKLFDPARKYLSKHLVQKKSVVALPPQEESSSLYNDSVNTLIYINMFQETFAKGRPQLQQELDRLSYMDDFYNFAIYDRYENSKHLLWEMEPAKFKPVEGRFKFIFFGSIADGNTTYQNSWDYYRSAKVSDKSWYLFKNFGHKIPERFIFDVLSLISTDSPIDLYRIVGESTFTKYYDGLNPVWDFDDTEFKYIWDLMKVEKSHHGHKIPPYDKKYNA